MIIIYSLAKIIGNTPLWVWLLLLVLIRRGISLKFDGAVSLKRALIIPSIFILWGIEKIFFGFTYPYRSFAIYILLLAIGSLAGYLLYSATQKYYVCDGIFMRKGNIVPLWITLINFAIKYMLNVAVNVNSGLLSSSAFNLVYSLIAGFTTGLFIGGIINTLLSRRTLEAIK